MTLLKPNSTPLIFPLNPPYEDQYVYNVASGVSTNVGSGEDETVHMASFVFKIFTPRDNNFLYIWTVSYMEDFRDGYIGHALTTFSWPKPESEIK